MYLKFKREMWFIRSVHATHSTRCLYGSRWIIVHRFHIGIRKLLFLFVSNYCTLLITRPYTIHHTHALKWKTQKDTHISTHTAKKNINQENGVSFFLFSFCYLPFSFPLSFYTLHSTFDIRHSTSVCISIVQSRCEMLSKKSNNYPAIPAPLTNPSRRFPIPFRSLRSHRRRRSRRVSPCWSPSSARPLRTRRTSRSCPFSGRMLKMRRTRSSCSPGGLPQAAVRWLLW